MLDYGQIQPGEHKDMSFVVGNPGQGLLTGTVQSSNPNFVVPGDGRFSLAAGQEMQIDIRFCPTTVDTFWGQITFTSNAGTQMKVVTGNARVGKRVRLTD